MTVKYPRTHLNDCTAQPNQHYTTMEYEYLFLVPIKLLWCFGNLRSRSQRTHLLAAIKSESTSNQQTAHPSCSENKLTEPLVYKIFIISRRYFASNMCIRFTQHAVSILSSSFTKPPLFLLAASNLFMVYLLYFLSLVGTSSAYSRTSIFLLTI
jgi:hypothetical protein